VKLWLVKRIAAADWDEYQGFVIRAETELEARRIANGDKPDSFPFDYEDDEISVWLNPDLSTCEELTADGEAGIVLYDFNAG
jgi:hypothetical protein